MRLTNEKCKTALENLKKYDDSYFDIYEKNIEIYQPLDMSLYQNEDFYAENLNVLEQLVMEHFNSSLFKHYDKMRNRVIMQSETIEILNEQVSALQEKLNTDLITNYDLNNPIPYKKLKGMLYKRIWFEVLQKEVILLEVTKDTYNNITVEVLETDKNGNTGKFGYVFKESKINEGAFYKIVNSKTK